jgi:D-alanyl-D-alanine carboxypeptidase
LNKLMITAAMLAAAAILAAGCGDKPAPPPVTTTAPQPTPVTPPDPAPSKNPSNNSSNNPPNTNTPAPPPEKTPPPASGSKPGDANQTAASPDSISVMINKQFKLPDQYSPKDLVYPEVPFLFNEKIEKRKMRQEAATALEKLFAGAKKDKIGLAGVSAYRSRATQKSLYDNYVKRDGEAKANMYSAVPGHSEHETGLAIDVSGSTGKCAAEDCFAGTPEAKWLESHAAEYGFIIRYPKGKEALTGYQYEPWHIRYVGTALSKEIASKGITLEEYYNTVPVSQ